MDFKYVCNIRYYSCCCLDWPLRKIRLGFSVTYCNITRNAMYCHATTGFES